MWLFKRLMILTFVIALNTITYAQDENVLYFTGVSWSNDGQKIAAVSIQYPGILGRIEIIDALTGDVLYRQDAPSSGFSSVAWSPDDRFIAIGSYDQRIWVINVETQSQVATMSGHRATITSVDWNSDGTRLVSGGSTDQQLILWDMQTYQPIRIVDMGDVWSVAFSPDDQTIAAGGVGVSLFPATLDVGNRQQQRQYRYFNNYDVGSIAWNRDGSQVAFGTQAYNTTAAQLNIINSNNAELLLSLQTGDSAINNLAWSTDDSLIATRSIDGIARVWDLNTGTQLNTYIVPNGYRAQTTFSPYAGQLALANLTPINPPEIGVQTESIQDGLNTLANGAVQIVVPDPSIERLQAIAEACNAAPQVDTAINATLDQVESNARPIDDFIVRVETLPQDALPPGCAADLLAVAEAIAAE